MWPVTAGILSKRVLILWPVTSRIHSEAAVWIILWPVGIHAKVALPAEIAARSLRKVLVWETAAVGAKVILIAGKVTTGVARETVKCWVAVEAVVKSVEGGITARFTLDTLEHHVKQMSKVGSCSRSAKVGSFRVLVQDAISHIRKVPKDKVYTSLC